MADSFSFGGRLTPLAKLTDDFRNSVLEQSIRKRTATTTAFLRDMLGGDGVEIAEDADGFLDQIKSGEILVRLGYKVTGQDIARYNMTGSFWKHLIEFKECCIDMGLPAEKCFGPTELQNRRLGPILECLCEVQSIWEQRQQQTKASSSSGGSPIASTARLLFDEAQGNSSSSSSSSGGGGSGGSNQGTPVTAVLSRAGGASNPGTPQSAAAAAALQILSGSKAHLRFSFCPTGMCLKSDEKVEKAKVMVMVEEEEAGDENNTTTIVAATIAAGGSDGGGDGDDDADADAVFADGAVPGNARISLLREMSLAHEGERARLATACAAAEAKAEEHRSRVAELTAELALTQEQHAARMAEMQQQHQDALAADAAAAQAAVAEAVAAAAKGMHACN